MDGFNFSFGVRPVIGYRYFGKWNHAVLIGIQNSTAYDLADFSAGDRREFILKINSVFTDYEFGYNWGSYFVNGAISLHFNRQTELKGKYKTVETDSVNSLSGTYKGGTSFSSDVGIVFGYFNEPIILTAKITFPVYTGGESQLLKDSRTDKQTSTFPKDYIKYSQGQSYPGVASNIDGLKIIISLSYAISISK